MISAVREGRGRSPSAGVWGVPNISFFFFQRRWRAVKENDVVWTPHEPEKEMLYPSIDQVSNERQAISWPEKGHNRQVDSQDNHYPEYHKAQKAQAQG